MDESLTSSSRRNRSRMLAGALSCLLAMGGCQPETPRAASKEEPIAMAPEAAKSYERRVEDLQAAMARANPGYVAANAGFREGDDGEIEGAEFNQANVKDLSPLAGLPLRFLALKGNPVDDLAPLTQLKPVAGRSPLVELYLEETGVADLSPLAGMPLRSLWLNRCPVKELGPLKGLALRQLNLLGTGVTDLAALSGMPLESLWLNETAVVDLSPLAELPLVSLTLHKAPVAELGPVARIPSLQRLHMGETQIADVGALRPLRLTRLILTPARIQSGMDQIRQMSTLRELDVEFVEGRPLLNPETFWARYDAGKFRADAAPTDARQ